MCKQVKLAIQLERIRIHLIQTEGKSYIKRRLSVKQNKSFNAIYYSSSTISSAYILSKITNIYTIASSSIIIISVLIAFTYGTPGISIRSTLNHFYSIYQMADYLKEITISLNFMNKSAKLVAQRCFLINKTSTLIIWLVIFI